MAGALFKASVIVFKASIFVHNKFLMKLPSPKLTTRMKSFIDHAIVNAPFWDVCCDHGYVGIKALISGQFSEVHFVDQIPHIMKRLQTLIYQNRELRSEHIYELHICSGEDISRDVEGTLLIAGVGGLTMKNILSALINKGHLQCDRILLSPHTDEKVIVEYIMSDFFQGLYRVDDKKMLPEGKRERPLYILNRK